MRKEIAIGVVTTVLGLFVGYFLKEYQDRPEPSLIIESIEFRQIEHENTPNIEIEPDLISLSRDSQWMNNLETKISLSDLHDLLNGGLDETVQELEKISLFLPKLMNFVQRNRDRQITTNEYRAFLGQESNALTLTYLTMNIAGAIRRKEFLPTQLVEQYPEAVASTSILGRGKQAEWKIEELSVEEGDKSSILALALIAEWYPVDLEAAVEVVQDQVSPQLVINQQILRRLRDKYESAKIFRYQDFVNISALVVNSGDKTVSTDQYAALFLHGLNRKFFLISDKQKGRLAIPPGEVRNISFRSDGALSAEESDQLKTLYDTKIINCQLTMRIVTEQDFTPRWLHSEKTEFSGDTTKLRDMFLDAAPIMSNTAN